MKTATQRAYPGRLEGAILNVFSHAADKGIPADAHAVRPHRKHLAWGEVLFALIRLLPAMVWFGNFGWNR